MSDEIENKDSNCDYRRIRHGDRKSHGLFVRIKRLEENSRNLDQRVSELTNTIKFIEDQNITHRNRVVRFDMQNKRLNFAVSSIFLYLLLVFIQENFMVYIQLWIMKLLLFIADTKF